MKWPMVKLGDICDLQNGYAFKSSDYTTTSNTMSCRMSNIRPGGVFDIDYNARFLPDNFSEKYSQFLLKDGDVIIAMTDLADSPKILGVPTVVKTEGRNILLNQRVGKLEIKDKANVYFPYLKLALNYPSVRSVYKKFAGGGLQINLGKADLLSVQIPLPPLEEQKRIAAILDKADAICRKRQQAIDLADEFLRSVFLDMFGDPVTNPKGWEVKTVEEVSLKVTDGVHAKPNYIDAGIPFISVKNIINGRISFDDTKFISPEDHIKYSKRCNVEKRDIIYTKVGATYGRAALVETDEEFSLYVSMALIKPNHDLIDARFLTEVMNSSSVKRQADRSIKGAGVPDLHLVEIKSFLIPVPDLNTQRGFVSKVNGIYKKVEKYKKALLKLDELFNSLSQKAFSGEL